MKVMIEILGLPGAGKSTLLDRLARDRSGLPALLKPIDPGGGAVLWKIALLTAGMALRNPVSLLRLALRSDGRWLLSKLAYRWAGLQLRPDAGVLLDSGLLQPLLSYAAEYSRRPVRVDDALAALRGLPLPQAVVYLDSGVETAHRRYRQRQQLTGRRAEAEVTSEGFAQAQEICDRIVGMFPPTQVMRVAGGDIRDAALDEIAARLIFWTNDPESRKL